jgi:hypothetical protein
MPIWHCPVCGFGPFFEPYDSVYELRCSFDICECCGCEYGYDDHEAHYKQWSESGFPGFNPKLKPINWSIASQLAHQVRPWPPERGET